MRERNDEEGWLTVLLPLVSIRERENKIERRSVVSDQRGLAVFVLSCVDLESGSWVTGSEKPRCSKTPSLLKYYPTR